MNKNLHSPKILTEFARDFEEEPSSIFNKFVKLTASIYSASENRSSVEKHVDSKPSSINEENLYDEDKINDTPDMLSHENSCQGPSTDVRLVEERTSINVLKRLSNLVSHKSNVNHYKVGFAKFSVYRNFISEIPKL